MMNTTTERKTSPCRILSIQSHVVCGYVGNKAAVFPLQLLKHHVDVINCVQYTSMYIHEGEKMGASSLKKILDTLPLAQVTPGEDDFPGPLKEDAILDPFAPIDHKYLLSGYIGSADCLSELINFVRNQKQAKRSSDQQFMWFCDPVMGDNGKLYVPEEVMQIYKTNVVPLADIITPNQYELQWLCDSNVNSLHDAIKCCRDLHARGPRIVVVTSMAFPQSVQENGAHNGTEHGIQNGEQQQSGNHIACKGHAVNDSFPNQLTLLASERTEDGDRQFTIQFPKLDIYLGGTGDLMASMILDGLDKYEGQLDVACERALGILQVRHRLYNKHLVSLVSVFHLFDLCFGRELSKRQLSIKMRSGMKLT